MFKPTFFIFAAMALSFSPPAGAAKTAPAVDTTPYKGCSWTAKGSYFAQNVVFSKPPQLIKERSCEPHVGEAPKGGFKPTCAGFIFCKGIKDTQPTEALAVGCEAKLNKAQKWICKSAPECAADPAIKSDGMTLPEQSTPIGEVVSPRAKVPATKGEASQ